VQPNATETTSPYTNPPTFLPSAAKAIGAYRSGVASGKELTTVVYIFNIYIDSPRMLTPFIFDNLVIRILIFAIFTNLLKDHIIIIIKFLNLFVLLEECVVVIKTSGFEIRTPIFLVF